VLEIGPVQAKWGEKKVLGVGLLIVVLSQLILIPIGPKLLDEVACPLPNGFTNTTTTTTTVTDSQPVMYGASPRLLLAVHVL
jgi:hypothetical protein